MNKIEKLRNLKPKTRDPKHKYSNDEVMEMLKALSKGIGFKEIASIYGVNAGTIAQITKRAAYKIYLQQLNDPGEISDGYHTFNELYEHRHCLFAQIAEWKSRQHSDGTSLGGWFIAGKHKEKGKQITYHIPVRLWDLFSCEELPQAPDYDKHTSDDVLQRLKSNNS